MTRSTASLLTLLALAALTALCLWVHARPIEQDVAARAARAMDGAGLPGVQMAVDGRDVVLSGTVPNEAVRQSLVARFDGLFGVRRVVDRLTVPESLFGTVGGGGLQLISEGTDLAVRGRVPDDAKRNALLSLARSTFPGRTVRDALTVGTGGLEPPPFLAALAAMGDVEGPGVEASAGADGQAVVLYGTVASAAAREAVEARVRASLPEGTALRNEIVVAGAPTNGAAGGSQTEVESADPSDADVQGAQAALRESFAVGAVEFESGTATLTERSRQILDQAAAVFERFPAVGAEVQGYTDSEGDDAANLRLSTQRAEAVRDYLAGRGIAGPRLTPRGFGEANPVADNATAEGRARNRRVVFRLDRR